MRDIKRKVIAILLTIFQIVSLISPAGVAVAAPGDEGFNANTFQYGVKIDATVIDVLRDKGQIVSRHFVLRRVLMICIRH